MVLLPKLLKSCVTYTQFGGCGFVMLLLLLILFNFLCKSYNLYLLYYTAKSINTAVACDGVWILRHSFDFNDL